MGSKTKDKCNLCGWVGNSDLVEEKYNPLTGETTWHCPVCDSQDVDDVSFNPYEDDEEEDSLLCE